MPLVSLGVPVWNGAKYLHDALHSIQAQTFRDFEVLISDNDSTDATREIAERFCREDPRFRLVRQPRNIGASANFNHVFAHTTGALFKWQAYDDVLAPDFLERCVGALTTGPGREAVLAYTGTQLIDERAAPLRVYDSATRKGGASASARLSELIGPGDPRQSLLHMCFPVFGLIRRSALERTNLIANMPRSDQLLLVELALLGSFAEIEAPLFLRREHDDGSVIAAERAATGPELERRLAAWFDPKRGKRFPATTTRLGLGYCRAAMTSPLPPREKARAMARIGGWWRRHARIIGGEVKILARERTAILVAGLRGSRSVCPGSTGSPSG